MSNILLVESVGVIRIKFERTLTQHGITSFEVIDGSSIYKSISEKHFKNADLIFIDCDNKSFELGSLKHLKADVLKPTTKLVAISSVVKESTLTEFLDHGFHDILAKPYSDIKLMEKIFKYKTLGSFNINNQENASDDISPDTMYDWHEDLMLGIESIDTEHRSLIEYYKHLSGRMRQGMGHEYYKEFVAYLDNYIISHFNNEEAFLDGINYTELDHHKKLHRQFTDQFLTVYNALKKGEITNKQLIQFNLFIKNWWLYHILVEDRQYIEYYKSQQENKVEDNDPKD